MYIGKIAPLTIKVAGKTYYLEGEHTLKSTAFSQARILREQFDMAATVRKKHSVYAVYAR